MSQMSYESCPGCVVELDPRTNTIFIRTYPYYLEQFTAVITALDKPTPAVLVEARIVQVRSNDESALGIQWGADFSSGCRSWQCVAVRLSQHGRHQRDPGWRQ